MPCHDTGFLGSKTQFRRHANAKVEASAEFFSTLLEHKAKRPRLRKRDRIFWVWLSRLWAGWRSVPVIVQPDTVVRWHRDGFRLYWRWKSSAGKLGRPRIEAELRKLIRRMCRENPLWGAPRIHSELRLLGYDVSETTVDKYMIRHRKPSSQIWRTFLKNHMPDTVGVGFFTMPTATFRILYAFIVLCHHRRRVMHFNVTQYPTAERRAQQIIEAFPEDQAPRFLIRDRGSIYGHCFKKRIKNMGIEEVVTARRSPWQDPYVERVHGSIRRGCLNQVVVLNAQHLKRVLSSYLAFFTKIEHIFRSIETRRHPARLNCLGKARWSRHRESAGCIIAIVGPRNSVHASRTIHDACAAPPLAP